MYDVIVSTNPRAWYGTAAEPLGGKGDPPNITRYSITLPRKGGRAHANPDTEKFHTHWGKQQAVKDDEEIKFELDFSKGFDPWEWIEFSFSTKIGNKKQYISGVQVKGIVKPSGEVGPVIEGIGGAAAGAVKSFAMTPTLEKFNDKLICINQKLIDLSHRLEEIEGKTKKTGEVT